MVIDMAPRPYRAGLAKGTGLAAVPLHARRNVLRGACAVSESKAVDHPRSPTGRRVIATPVAPTSNTDRIPGRGGTRFGLSYVLGGSGKEVEVRRVFRFPEDGMPNSSTGRKTGSYEDLERMRSETPC
jgi:hypothetical protein